MAKTFAEIGTDADGRGFYAATIAAGDELVFINLPKDKPIAVSAFPSGGATADVETTTSSKADVLAGTDNRVSAHSGTGSFTDVLIARCSAISVAATAAAVDVELSV